MIRWIQIGILAVLLCVCAFGRADNSKASAGQTSETQQGTVDNSQQGPSAAPDQSSTPQQTQGQEQPTNSTSQQQPTVEPQTPGTQPEPKQRRQHTVKKSSAHARTSTKKKSSAKNGDQSGSSKVVVRNGGAKDSSPQLSPGMTSEQALHSRENTAQLLATTDRNLKVVAGRQLSAAQQSMLDQIHSYVRQSKSASASGDLTRAHTLAYKAHLLSDNLAGK